jgi:hypothetical protein
MGSEENGSEDEIESILHDESSVGLNVISIENSSDTEFDGNLLKNRDENELRLVGNAKNIDVLQEVCLFVKDFINAFLWNTDSIGFVIFYGYKGGLEKIINSVRRLSLIL